MPIEAVQSIHLERDGSGVIFRQVFYRSEITKVVRWFETRSGREPSGFPINESKLRSAAAGFGTGVTFLSAQPQTSEKGWEGYGVIYSFDDINQVRISHGDNDSSCGSDCGGNTNITFSLVEDMLEINLPQENPAREPIEKSMVQTQTSHQGGTLPKWILSVFNGFRIATALIVESGIKATDATYVNRDSIVLLDIAFTPLFKSVDFPEILEKLKQSQNLEDLKSIVRDLDGLRIEMQPVVRVQLDG